MRNLIKMEEITNIEKILAILQDQTIPNRISEQVEEILDRFTASDIEVKSPIDFNRELTRFLQQVYQGGLLAERAVSAGTALSEALDLLEYYYDAQGSQGYDAAYLDAVSPYGKGFESVLRQLAEIIKQRELQRYSNWLFSSTFDPTDWDNKRNLVIALIEKLKSYLPEDILQGNPARFIKYYRELIEMALSTENLLERVTSASKNISGT
jgi:hypothetical protein